MDVAAIFIWRRAVIAWLLRVLAIVAGIGVIGFSFYIKFRYDTPWVSVRNHHIKGFPWDWVLAALALIAWALGDLWLYGGPKARRQAKLDAQRQAQEVSAGPSANPQPPTGPQNPADQALGQTDAPRQAEPEVGRH